MDSNEGRSCLVGAFNNTRSPRPFMENPVASSESWKQVSPSDSALSRRAVRDASEMVHYQQNDGSGKTSAGCYPGPPTNHGPELNQVHTTFFGWIKLLKFIRSENNDMVGDLRE
jgi:hypothetical protein